MIYHLITINHSYIVNIELYNIHCFLKLGFDSIARHKCLLVFQLRCLLFDYSNTLTTEIFRIQINGESKSALFVTLQHEIKLNIFEIIYKKN